MVQQSLLEKLNGTLGTVAKSRCVDNFSGDSLDEMWTAGGTGSGAMNDAVNGGYRITTGASTNDFYHISFNNSSRHYSNTGSVFVLTCNRNTTLARYFAGLANNTSFTSNFFLVDNDNTNSFYRLKVGASNVDTSIAVDTTVRTSMGILKSASASLSIDGSLEAISTSNLPSNQLQPSYVVQTKTTAAATGDITFMEAYNI